MQGFDFDNALTMHRTWKRKLHPALGSLQGRDYDTRPLGDAVQGSPGQWLMANASELEPCVAAREPGVVHEDFRRTAQAVADDIRGGRVLSMGDPAIAACPALSDASKARLARLGDEFRDGLRAAP